MHELSVARSLAEFVCEQITELDLTHERVAVVHIRMGALCDVAPLALKTAFSSVVIGTPLQSARLEIEVVDLVVFCRRSEQGRAITEILAVAPQVGDGDELTTGTVFSGVGSTLRWTGELPSGLERFAERGIDLMAVLR